jgi:hypothetical protein
METISQDILNDPMLLTMLTRMGEKITELENLPNLAANLDQRISNLEKQTDIEASDIHVPSSSELELRDIRFTELESQIAVLESPQYRENVILDWLHNLDQDSYYALGVRKGYLEEINPENQPPLGDLKDPSPEVIFSQEKPEDLTGWAYSKNLNCYVKLEGGMEV